MTDTSHTNTSLTPGGWRRAFGFSLACIFVALALWSGTRFVVALDADPSSRWPDYLILIFPALFLVLAAGFAHAAITRGWTRRRTGKQYAVGSLVVVSGIGDAINNALKHPTAGGRIFSLVLGLAVTFGAVILLRHFHRSDSPS